MYKRQSDASNYDPVAFIRTSENSIIESDPPPATMKVLGFIFSNSPTAREHIVNVRKKFRQRFWTLWNLKRNGFTEEELVTVYKSSIRPVVDYLDVVYHSMLTDDLDEELDLFPLRDGRERERERTWTWTWTWTWT